MKNKMQKVLVILLALMMVFSLGACSTEKVDKGIATDPATTEGKDSSTATEDRVEIEFWGDWGGEGQKQFEYMLTEFNKSQDKVVAKYVLQQDMITKFLTASVTGEAPDIMFWDRYRTALYAPKGVLHPINDYMKRDGIKEEEFYSEAIKELTNDGNLYGLPLTVDNRSLFYNKTMFEEKGIKPPTTWEEMREAAKKLTVWNGDKMEVSGLSLSDVGLFNMWIQQAGGQMLNDEQNKTAFNSQAGLDVLDFWSQLMFEDKVYTLGFESGLGEGVDAFATGKVAMTYTGPWMLSTYESYGDDLDFGIVAPPAGPNGDKGGLMGGFGLVIPESAKHKEEAWELMKWWLSQPENAATYAKMSKNIPGVHVATEDEYFAENEYYKAFLDTFEFAKIRPTIAQYPNMEEKAVIPQLQLFMEGKITAKEALDSAQKLGDVLLLEKAE